MALTGPRLSGPGHSDCCRADDASSENAASSQAAVQSREAEEGKQNTLVQGNSHTDASEEPQGYQESHHQSAEQTVLAQLHFLLMASFKWYEINKLTAWTNIKTHV